MNFKVKSAGIVVILGVLASISFGEVRLPSVIGDNMVVQQKDKVAIWGWAEAGERIAVKGSWQWLFGKTVKADEDGKWMVHIPTPKAGGPYSIHIKGENEITIKNVMSGEVWVCSGQSNMHFLVRNANDGEAEVAAADYPNIRLFQVPMLTADEPQEDVEAEWVQCSPETAGDFSAVGYFFGRQLYKELDVPIGLIHTSWGGTPAEAWTRIEVLEADEDFVPIIERFDEQMRGLPKAQKEHEEKLAQWEVNAKKARAAKKQVPAKPRFRGPQAQKRPGRLYNAMVAPLIPYGIKGAIWYQGEANAERAYQYRKLFPAMIGNWRNDWGQGAFPFYFVQIAPFTGQNPEIREAQMLTMKTVPNTGMVVTTDIGNTTNIHPKNKQDVGKRLALWALAKTYGRDGLTHSGPIYKEHAVEGNKIRLSFDHVDGGLVARDGALTDFTIAGKDKSFVDAKAVIDGDTIVVSSGKIKKPVSVRFGWTNTAEPNLFNKAMLPASPFRTDDWPGETYNER
jgi:sialate O-acetylesterase